MEKLKRSRERPHGGNFNAYFVDEDDSFWTRYVGIVLFGAKGLNKTMLLITRSGSIKLDFMIMYEE